VIEEDKLLFFRKRRRKREGEVSGKDPEKTTASTSRKTSASEKGNERVGATEGGRKEGISGVKEEFYVGNLGEEVASTPESLIRRRRQGVDEGKNSGYKG